MKLIERKEDGRISLHLIFLPLILAAGLAVGLLIPEGGLSWSLFGFAERSVAVGDENLSIWLDTSGAGPYEIALRDDCVEIIRCGAVLWEGGFVSAEYCRGLMAEALAEEDRPILEHVTEGTASLVCGGPDGGGGYVFMTEIDGSKFGAVFHTPGDSGLTGEEALEYAHRLRFTKVD